MESNIIKEFKKLQQDVAPRAEWITSSRAFLLQQINPHNAYHQEKVGVFGFTQLFGQSLRRTLFEPAVMMLLVLGVFLGSSLTINAAFYSLPGDGLYSIKIALEKTHVALVPDQQKKVELRIEFAEKRIAELDKIVTQSDLTPEQKKKQIAAVVKEFRNNVVSVGDSLNRINISEEEKQQTVKMAVTISSKTNELAKSFDEKVGSLSEMEKVDIEQIVAEAVESVQQTGQAADQLVESAGNGEATASDINNQTIEEGIVEGVSTEEVIAPEESADIKVEAQLSESVSDSPAVPAAVE